MTLVLRGLFFLLLPRQAGATRSRSGHDAKHLTGFDKEVKLGQLGEILENDSVVMSVEFTDENGEPHPAATRALWRGVTLIRYEKGRWHRPHAAVDDRRSSASRPFATAARVGAR